MKLTSVETYAELLASGKLGQRQREVIKALRNHGPMTGQEINRELGNQNGHKRLSELATLGIVVEMAPRYCRVTGRKAIEWQLKYPVSPPTRLEKPPTRAELEHEIWILQERVADLEHQLEIARMM